LLDRLGIERHAAGESRRSFRPEQDHTLAILYRNGATSTQLAKQYGVDKSAVLQALRREGVELRNGGRPAAKITKRMIAQIVAMYDSGMSRGVIARKHCVHGHAIDRVLRSAGRSLEIRKGRENHPSWKGGIYDDKSGYRRVLLAPDDPYYGMCASNGYVMEHRVVMARALGRALEDHESVHHIDGNRQNNVLANLELRQGKHGSGVRFICRDCGSHNVEAIPLKDQP
jgi:transposase-like protein